MSISSNVSTRISKPDSADERAARKNGARCHDTSCTCGRVRTTGHQPAQVGQAVTSELFLRSKQDIAKYNLYMFMTKLLGLYGSSV